LPFYDVLLLADLPKSAGLPVGSTQLLRQRLLTGHSRYRHFDYVFYTESDQIAIVRELPMLYSHLRAYPGHMLLPHRLMPYSAEAMIAGHRREDITKLSRVLYNVTREEAGGGGKEEDQQDRGKINAFHDLDKSSTNAFIPAPRSPPPPPPPPPRVGVPPKNAFLYPEENKWMKQSCCLPRQNCIERKSWLGLGHAEVPVIQYYGMYVPLGNVNFLKEEYRYCTLTDYVGDYCP
jgi:hypothetical protein